MSSIGEPTDPGQGEQGISRLIADEVRALVLAAMRELTPAQRKVLTMRCYEEMPYSEIGFELAFFLAPPGVVFLRKCLLGLRLQSLSPLWKLALFCIKGVVLCARVRFW